MGNKWFGITALLVLGSVAVIGLTASSPKAETEISDQTVDLNANDDQDRPPNPVDQPPPLDPFVLYPAGEEALRYEELDAIEQRHLDDSGEWAETGNGYSVHASWSNVARKKREEAEAKRALQVSGTQGFDDLGVQ